MKREILGGSALYVVLAAVVLSLGLRQTGGTFLYPLDDTYIHLAIAKTFSQTGVWGITPDGYAPATSSPLFTGLLALLFRVTGPWAGWALLVNLLAGILLIAFSVNQWTAFGLKKSWQWILLLALLLEVSLVHLSLIGMEHVLHALLLGLLIKELMDLLSGKGRTGRLVVWGILAGGIRYETLFWGFAGALLLLVRRRWRESMLLAGSVWGIPVVVGVLNVLQGWPFLPTTLLLKSLPYGSPSAERFGVYFLQKLWRNLHDFPEVIGFVLSLFWIFRFGTGEQRKKDPVLLFGTGVGLHLLFAKAGWYLRYEAYMVYLALLIIGMLIPSLQSRKDQMVALASVILPLAPRSLTLFLFPTVLFNIFALPYQSANLLQRFPSRTPVALWDIGLPAYLTEARILDVVGLAHREVATLRLAGKEEHILPYLIHHDQARVIVVYDTLFPYGKRNAHFIGSWGIPATSWKVVGGPRMSVYVARCEDIPRFAPLVRDFFADLPARIQRSFQPDTSRCISSE